VCEEHKKVADLCELFERVRLDLHDASLLMNQEAFPADPGREVPYVFLYSTTIRSVFNSYGIVIK
jgi:hypothetical protein